MKRLIAVLLLLLMLFSFSGCSKTPAAPAFSEEALTQAQEYAYEAIHNYEIHKSLSLISADVLLTEDISKAIPGNIITKDWEDVQDTRAIVLARYGNLSKQTSEEEGSEEGEEKEVEPSLVMAFFLNEDKKTVAEILVSGINAGSSSAPAATGELYAIEEDMLEISTVRRQLASAELAAEAFVEENAEQENFAAFAAQLQAAPQTIDGLADPALLQAAGDDRICTEYWERLWYCAVLREEVAHREAMQNLVERSEWYKANELLESDKALWEQKYQIVKEYANVERELAAYEAAHAEEIVPLQEKQAAFSQEDSGDWWDDTEYLQLCLSSDTLNQYDVLLRQQRIFESSFAMLREAAEEEDVDRREYMAEKLNVETEAFSDYSNAVKVYVQCVTNQETFLTENALELSAYEAAEAAAREAAGAEYEDDIEYIKVQITYEELIKQRNAHESAVTNSKAAADEIRTEMEEEIAEIEADEAERQREIAIVQMKKDLREYLTEAHESVSEYEAGADQWGSLHADFAAYQNKHLTYLVEKTYTPPKNNSSSGSGGMKYDPNDENYSSHDYDGDGKLSDKEFQDAFNDYVDKIMGG